MPTTTENGKQTGRPSLRLWVALIIAFLTYVLSVGPVLTLADRIGVGRTRYVRPLRAFYAPVFALAKSSNAGTWLYEGYVGMWSQFVLKKPYPKPPPPAATVEGLLVSVGSITNGQSAFEIFIPSELTHNGGPTGQNVAIALIVSKVREQGLLPAGQEERPGGKLYRFEKTRAWEVQANGR